MHIKTTKLGGVAVLLGVLLADNASAFNFGNMMNPGRWFDNNDDDYYYDRGPGYGYPGGYGGYGGYPGYGYPGGGWGAPGYGGGPYGAPGYSSGAATTQLPAAPPEPPKATPPKRSTSAGGDEAEIERLRRRVRELESTRMRSSDWHDSATGEPRYGSGGYQYAPSEMTFDGPSDYQQRQPSAWGSQQPSTGSQRSGSSFVQPAPGFGSQPQQYGPSGGTRPSRGGSGGGFGTR
jgi:hypothetical protein